MTTWLCGEKTANMSPRASSHNHTHIKKGTDCCSARMDHEHAGKVSFVLSVNEFPSGLPMNDVPCSRETAGGCENDIKLWYQSSFPYVLPFCQSVHRERNEWEPQFFCLHHLIKVGWATFNSWTKKENVLKNQLFRRHLTLIHKWKKMSNRYTFSSECICVCLASHSTQCVPIQHCQRACRGVKPCP